MIRTITVLITLASSLLIFTAGNRSARQVQTHPPASVTVNGTCGIKVAPLDDEANPYLGMYREWDQWIYDNAVAEPAAHEDGIQPENWQVLYGHVTSDGYLLPCEVYTRLRQAAWAGGTIDEFPDRYCRVVGEGEMPAELAENYKAGMDRINASFYPAIPQWLAESPPHSAMLLPDGNIVTYGAPGDGSADEKALRCARIVLAADAGQPVSAIAEQVNLSPSGVRYWLKRFHVEKNGWPEGDLQSRRDGYFIFTHYLTGEILSIWDYDGTKLETTAQPPVRDAHNFIFIPAAQRADYYRYQHE